MALPVLPTDPARLHVAMWKIANALSLQLDPTKPDHELLELIAEHIEPLALLRRKPKGEHQR